MYNFKRKKVIFSLALIVMMIPSEILLLPMYQMMIRTFGAVTVHSCMNSWNNLFI